MDVGRHSMLAAVAIVVGSFASSLAGPQNPTQKAEAEIAAAREAFWKAHGQGDAKTLAALLTSDATLLAPGMEDVRGRQAIEAAAAQMFQTMAVAGFTIHTTELTVHGDSAYELTSYSETLRSREGDVTPVRGRYLIVWKRDAQGRWKVHRNMFNFVTQAGH